MKQPVVLLDIRDQVHMAKRLVVGIYLASQAPNLPSSERGALCEMADITRKQLEQIEQALDLLITVEAKKPRRMR